MKRKFLMAAMCFVMAGTLCAPGNVMAEEAVAQSVATTENVDADGTEDGYVVPEVKEWEYSLGTNKIFLEKYIGKVGKAEKIKVPATYTVNGKAYQVDMNQNLTYNFMASQGIFSCTPVKEVMFEDGVKASGSFYKYMFRDCQQLVKTNLPSGIKGDCQEMFTRCKSLTETPDIPEGVEWCGGMFSECSSLTKAPDIPAGVESCGSMFYGCSSLTKAPDIPTGVKYTSEMFEKCSKLSGSMKIMGPIENVKDMFKDAATEGDGLTIYYADGVNIDEILATKSENSKITAVPLSQNPTPDTPTPSNPTPATPSGTKVAAYGNDTFYLGDDGKLRCYDKNGKLVTNEFKFDGTYTYYMQADGTPMKDRLTYHPDGEHIIYLDTEGHEVFANFQYCPSVDYICYFDSQGYLYKDQITFVGDKVYYLNANGALEQNGWFQFANGLDYGWANGDGTLITTGFSADPYGRTVFYHWNGMVARGLITDGVYYYNMDTTDGHYLGQFPVQ